MKNSFKIFLFLFLIPLTLSTLCLNSDFSPILVNKENTFELGPNKESCYKYSLSTNKKKIILVFPKTQSSTSEVLLYKSKSDISMSNNSYKNYLDRFLINENSFKEIDLKNYETEIYIIIRDGKFSEVYNNHFILYDTEIPITLTEAKPLTIRYFVKNTQYKFEFSSNKNLTFVYSTKVKSKKNISITYDGQTILEKSIDTTDHIFNLRSENTSIKKLYVTVEDIEEGNEDQEFSVIVYEKNITQFFEIKRGNIYTTNYLSLNKDDEKQIFFFYYNLGTNKKINTINFKLDPINKISEYINIQSGVYHSMRAIPDEEKDIYFRFTENKFPIEYDINSDEYKKIYFQDTDTSFTYRYIFFKVEISKLEQYFSPKNFIITIGYDLSEKNYKSIEYYNTQTIKETIKPFIPSYMKLILDPKEKYILTSPLPDQTIFTKGDLLLLDENNNFIINEDHFADKDEIILLSNTNEITISIINSESKTVNFYLEKYIQKDIFIIENYRNYEPFELVFTEDECNDNKKKYLLGIYNKEIYSKYNRTYTKYWTSNDGDFEVYYRNNITLEKESLFPSYGKYYQKKEYTILLNFHLDFFTFTCKKPGTLMLRSPYKIFNETTHKVGQNSFLKFTISNQVEILQLTAPLKPSTNFLYFAIFSKYGKKIKITPDYPLLFEERTIEGNQVFLKQIDLYKFEPDQLAIKLQAEESTPLEVVEVIRYNFTEYTLIYNEKKNILTNNHFVKFISTKTREIKLKINKLKNVEINYGIVQLFTNDLNFLPMAYQFKEDNIKEKKLKENKVTITINNPFLNNYDSRKYLAFIFSIPSTNYYEYEAQVIEDDKRGDNDDDDDDDDDDDEVNVVGIVFGVIGAIALFTILGIIIYYYIKNKKGTKEEFQNDIINDNENDVIENNNNNNSVNDSDNKDKNNINISSKYRNIIHKFDDEEDDKRLYKSFEDD